MRRIYTILLLCFLLTCEVCVTTANAVSMSMETSVISAEEKASIIENIDLQIIQESEPGTGIYCFDVSEDGMVALGFGSGTSSLVCIYDAAGTFQYGYRFYCDGAYGIEFHGEQLSIFFLRGNVLATYDSTGSCVDIQKAMSTEQNHAIIKDLLNRTQKDAAGKHYSLERDLGIGDSYSRLVTTDEDGERIVLYDVSMKHSVGQIVLIVFLVGFFFVVIRGCIQKYERDNQRT